MPIPTMPDTISAAQLMRKLRWNSILFRNNAFWTSEKDLMMTTSEKT